VIRTFVDLSKTFVDRMETFIDRPAKDWAVNSASVSKIYRNVMYTWIANKNKKQLIDSK